MKKVRYGFFILLGLAAASIAGYFIYEQVTPLRIKHMELQYLPENRLRLKVDVYTNKKSEAVLKFWRVGSKDTIYLDPSLDKRHHEIVIYNLQERKKYNYQVVTRHGEEVSSSKVYPFEMKSIYQTTPYFTLDSVADSHRDDLFKRYFLTQILTQPGAAVVINGQGGIVWYESFAKGVKVTSWTQDKTVLCILGAESIPSSGGDEIVEVDRQGRYVKHFKVGERGMDKMVHHEVRKDADGNIFAITFDKKIVDLSSVGGNKQDTVKGDGIVVFNPEGDKIWEWSVLDHIDLLQYPDILTAKKDLVHANSLYDDGKGHFLMSFRDLNQVWKIDRKTGKVIWKFGQNGDFKLDTTDQFYSQHWAHDNSRHELMLLDNGGKRKWSRALAFQLDEQTKEAKKTVEVTYPALYYSSVKGNSTLIDNRYVLTCLTDPRLFFITELDGNVIWKMGIGGDPYRIDCIDFE